MIRGGSWNNNARNCRSAYRNRNEPDNRNNNLGFRCARAHDRGGGLGPEQTGLRGSASTSVDAMPQPNDPRCAGSRRSRPAKARRWVDPISIVNAEKGR
ncbi:SUMF1/EgtB/PvdO family nonheme iron enzyme [Marichromatium gracile]|uniref:formylglycine-generating enzyme family protein n=1 Tax=Marichromatium gracile TaxID=1048 RepID=UPI001F2FAD9A|nr:SUMF1/EgtB/PvdO family nonheme iron enzyme [Marichromatium gracile]MCF1182037.1 SUMF1/EgtB/PvdO family nonheme iron enzyme [Marichromatium gracile]